MKIQGGGEGGLPVWIPMGQITVQVSINQFYLRLFLFIHLIASNLPHSGAPFQFLSFYSENNKPPRADAGPDKELILPVDSTTLDGSKSSDDQKIVSFLWEKTQYVSLFSHTWWLFFCMEKKLHIWSALLT